MPGTYGGQPERLERHSGREATERPEGRTQALDEDEIDEKAGQNGRPDQDRGLKLGPKLFLGDHADLLSVRQWGRST